MVDKAGCTRALVLEVAAPADWQRLRAVWQGVQADLGLPAPAIAVSGSDGLQLWFSADSPVPVDVARRWLQALASHYLPGLVSPRLRLYPGSASQPDADLAGLAHAPVVPAPQSDGGRWSAFVAPDLVPLFEETPWLDCEPGEDGQAALLERVAVMKPGWLGALPASGSAEGGDGSVSGNTAVDAAIGRRIGPDIGAEAVAFLRRVMQDEAAPLALRVEAAKALLMVGPRRDVGQHEPSY